MNANEKFIAAEAHVDEAAIAPLPNSRKIYVEGSRPEAELAETAAKFRTLLGALGLEATP